MNTQSTANEVRLPIAKLASAALLVCVLGAFAGGSIATTQGGTMRDGMLTLVATIPSVALGLMVLGFLPARIPGMWGVVVLGVSMARSLMALAIGVAVFLTMDPSKFVFFLSLLAVLLIVLVIEVASVMFLVHEHTPAQTGVAAEGV
ncbi:MAG: hypothetical protein KC996_01140 [Phycisphaerales bacterium]|nr:hypothetical protein [Phycisphaerales bacterium]